MDGGFLYPAFAHALLFGDQNSKLTIVKQRESGEMEILVKDGKKLTATRETKEVAKGMGNRLGVAYRLKDGSMVYVPDDGKGN